MPDQLIISDYHCINAYSIFEIPFFQKQAFTNRVRAFEEILHLVLNLSRAWKDDLLTGEAESRI